MSNKFLSYVFLALMVCMPSLVLAQSLKASGATVSDVVPSDWEVTSATGDLNGDGVADVAVIATPRYEANLKVRDDGYVYNFNQPVLAIYWGKADGTLQLYKQYDNVIPARPDEYLSIDPSLSITKRQTLVIDLEYFASAGGWTSTTTSYVFRYQQGDFFLIGMDENSLTRNTGETTIISQNYLTGKQCVTTGHIDSSKKKPKEKWSRLPKAPLQPLGTPLGDEE